MAPAWPANFDRRYRPWLTVRDARRAWLLVCGSRATCWWCRDEEVVACRLVMGLDQHRAQIAAESIDTMTAEISARGSRRRTAPGCVEFLAAVPRGRRPWRSRWRRPRAGGSWSRSWTGSARRCTWPSRPNERARRQQEAREDRLGGRRHQRELLLIGRLPESWIPPAHILDLRARCVTAGTCSRISARSGSSACSQSSITTVSRNVVT